MLYFESLFVVCLAVVCLAEEVNTEIYLPGIGMTSAEIIIVLTEGTVLLLLIIVLMIMLCRRCRHEKRNFLKDDEITPRVTVHISGILAPGTEYGICGLPGMYENLLKTSSFKGRLAVTENRKSPFENTAHLGGPYASLNHLYLQPRNENEDDGPCDVLIITRSYEKLIFHTRQKRQKKYETRGQSSYHEGVDASGLPVYKLDSWESESHNSRDIHTILEEASCDERSTLDRTATQEHLLEQISDDKESKDAISLQDMDFGCVVIDWQENMIQTQPSASLKHESEDADGLRSREVLHMDDQSGLVELDKSTLSQDAKA